MGTALCSSASSALKLVPVDGIVNLIDSIITGIFDTTSGFAYRIVIGAILNIGFSFASVVHDLSLGGMRCGVDIISSGMRIVLDFIDGAIIGGCHPCNGQQNSQQYSEKRFIFHENLQ
jgi:hypothetical protein